MSDKRWEMSTSTDNDIFKKIEDLLNKATQTVYSVAYIRVVVTVMLLMIIVMLVIKGMKYFN